MILYTALAGMASFSVFAQTLGDTFIKVEDHNMFSQCFEQCDRNGDGIVTYAEAEAATGLSLDKGGRLNIIDDYGFLKHFPNLETLSLGNTTQEEIDLHYQTRLKTVNVANALWLKRIVVGEGVTPQIVGQAKEDPFREAVKVQNYVSDTVARALLSDGFDYVEVVEQDGRKSYIVGMNSTGPYGLWRNDSLEVPCEYSIEEIKVNYFAMAQSTDVEFADDGFKAFCLRDKKIDVNKDGIISTEEAAATKKLSLKNKRNFIRIINSHEDLKNFPNLEYFNAGFNYLETIDVSRCPKLKKLDVSDSRTLVTIVVAEGCKPEIKYPVPYKGERAKIVFAK
jgi:hypothetical protein